MPAGKFARCLLLLCLPAAVAAQQASPEAPVCSAAEHSAYAYVLRQAIIANWEVPRRATAVSCTLIIAQNFRGEVLNAGVEDCGDDALVRKSVEDAAYRASPLPLPENSACFERRVVVRLVQRAMPAR